MPSLPERPIMIKRKHLLIWITLLNSIIINTAPLLTVLTAPIGNGSSNNYGGHFGVTRSLIEGLQKINASFNYNPSTIDLIGNNVIVLADINALRQAINLKKQGKIKQLLAGPNLMVRANEFGSILGSPEVDICIVPCEWVKKAYEEDCPALIGKISTWFAGVNTQEWLPNERHSRNKNVIVYWKTESESFCINIENILRKYQWNPIRIKYGHYNQQHYKKILNNCAFAVFISRSESQGLALAECWTMNIPSIVWSLPYLSNHGRYYSTCSACPYLTSATGIEWQNISEFENIIRTIDDRLPFFTPRQWVLDNMSDEKAAEFLLTIINTQKS